VPAGLRDDQAMPALARIPKNQPNAAPIPAEAAGKQQQQYQTSAASPSLQQQQQQDVATLPPGAESMTVIPGTDPSALLRPDSPRTFAYRQRELARDLIIKEQQIEYLIGRLPGIGASEAEQEARIRELEGQLRRVQMEKERKVRVLRKLGRRLEGVLGAVERGIY
jgi:mediator of RNA polymerase II transcription subunit 21